ncbi:hypothetical protein HZS_5167 [Henneguya salminicola]|nr:hypothetical protein HZS_5167 [Henneguya salminicola]
MFEFFDNKLTKTENDENLYFGIQYKWIIVISIVALIIFLYIPYKILIIIFLSLLYSFVNYNYDFSYLYDTFLKFCLVMSKCHKTITKVRRELLRINTTHHILKIENFIQTYSMLEKDFNSCLDDAILNLHSIDTYKSNNYADQINYIKSINNSAFDFSHERLINLTLDAKICCIKLLYQNLSVNFIF